MLSKDSTSDFFPESFLGLLRAIFFRRVPDGIPYSGLQDKSPMFNSFMTKAVII